MKRKDSTVPYDEESSKKVKHPYPKSVIFIIGNEFCERFSYYGMRTILVLYFRSILLYSENKATQAFHIFAMCCYFTPVLGAIIADSILGKFLTILIISVVYAAGNIILAFASINGNTALTFIGLTAIALGTGGIKPCVAAFGGDQFLPSQTKQLQSFFSLFYISINAGSLISTFITPILRQDVACGDRSDCYPLAFGIPAILMIVSLILFVVGKFVTNYRINPPAKENIVVSVVNCVFHALSRRMFHKCPKKDHWLDYSDDQYKKQTIEEVKILMSVLFLYIPLPIFWALFDQQASRWTLQATRMNGQLGSFIIKPDQIQVVNPLVIICFIPIFGYIIYPILDKLRILTTSLQRMTFGGILAGVSFIVCALFQLQIESEQPISMLPMHNHIGFVNGLNCDLTFYIDNDSYSLPPYQSVHLENVERTSITNFNQHLFIVNGSDSSCQNGNYSNVSLLQTGLEIADDESMIFFISEQLYHNSIDAVNYTNILVKPDEGGANLFTLFYLKNYDNAIFSSPQTNAEIKSTTLRNGDFTLGYLDKFEVEIKQKHIDLVVDQKTSQLPLKQGATYIVLVHGDLQDSVIATETNIVQENKLSVFFQFIQYIIMTGAEIMFSITGLEFSYSQAPKSMKSVLQAAWLLTVAFGNLIVAIIADLKIFEKQSYEFFFFAGLMLVDSFIFAIMAYFYVPSKLKLDESTTDDDDIDINGKPGDISLKNVNDKSLDD